MDIHRCRFVDYSPETITASSFSHGSSLERLSENDLRLAVGRGNGDIEIWNPQHNWTQEITLPGSRGRSIEGLCWSSGENGEPPRLFSIGGSTYITEWDLSTGKVAVNYDCNSGILWSIDVNKEGNKLVVGCDNGSVVIVDILGGFGVLEHETICQRQDARVMCIKWYNNDYLIGGCSDARLRVWSAKGETKGRLMSTMRVDKSKTESTLVWSIAVLPAKKQIVSGDSTGSLKFWDFESSTLLQNFKMHEADILTLATDVECERVFSAGVDRKIHQFSLVKTSSNSKWVHSFNRLLHSNDVRCLSIYESKVNKFLISGGVEKSIVIQSLSSFHDGKYKKITVSQHLTRVSINEEKKLIVFWQNQTIKIWKVSENQDKLVAKISLTDDDNITSIDLNHDATVLVVSRINSTRVFFLEEKPSGKLKVSKLRDDNFESTDQGAKIVKFIATNKFLALTSEEELFIFNINVESQLVQKEHEIDISLDTKNRLQYSNNIRNLVISPDYNYIAVSRYNGLVQMISLIDSSVRDLTRLNPIPNLIEFSSADKLLVLTEGNKLYEFNYKHTSKDSLLTDWSRRNSEFLPKQFMTLEDTAQGMFVKDSRVWIYGLTWVCFFDLSMNIPLKKSLYNGSKKRNRDGLTISTTEVENISDNEDSNANLNILSESARQSQIDRLKNEVQDSGIDNDGEDKPFWLTSKYRPVILSGSFGSNDIIVIERPVFDKEPSYYLPKIRI